MKRFYGVIVVLVGAFVLVGVAFSKANAKQVEIEKAQNLARIQREYYERVGWIRSNPDEKTYKEEVDTFFRWYFKEVDAHQTRYGLNKKFDDYLEELEKRASKSGKGDQAVADKKAYYDYAKNIFDSFRKGYNPVWSATDKGMRLDIVSSDVTPVMGKPQVRLALVLWGAQRDLRGEDGKVKKMVTSASFNVNWKLFDTKGKLFGEMNAQGDPAMKIDWPERLIAEFPPQMVLGHFDMDLLPADIAKMEITFNVSSSSSTGGSAAAAFPWKLDTPTNWKLREGEKWEGAEEATRSEEEINAAAAAPR